MINGTTGHILRWIKIGTHPKMPSVVQVIHTVRFEFEN